MIDILNFFPLVFVTGSVSFLFFQESLGFGLQYAFKNGFTTLWLSIYTTVAFIAFLFGTFRTGFKDTLINAFNFTKSVPAKASKAKQALLAPFAKKESIAKIEHDNTLKHRMDNILKDDKKEGW